MTPRQAYDLIEKEFGSVAPGVVYNFYECGHIIKNTEDVISYRYRSNKKQMRFRCCSHENCLPTKTNGLKGRWLITKFKKCARCGTETLSLKAKDSESCIHCPKIPIDPDNVNLKKFRNGHLQDKNRSSCKFYLTKCLKEYILYDAVPCKYCNDFEIGCGNVDVKDFANRRIAA